MTTDKLVVRPRRVLIAAWVGAVLVVGVFAVIAALLTDVYTGVYFRPADQLAVMLIGLFIAGGLLLVARPRVRADTEGIEVRNIVNTQYVHWSDVLAITFPDGASWARLELADDEYLHVMAIQAVDRERAVTAMRELRALRAGRPPDPT
ncbi:MAG: PH domain-containing protein [Pseudonocardia sp.]|nr:PH domain-containing protein [Pseudonocardia sp.]